MPVLKKGRYSARLAASEADLRAAQRLRYRTFFAPGAGAQSQPSADRRDTDRFDGICSHMLIEERRTGRLACCFRFLPMATGAMIDEGYSAQYYELSALHAFEAPMVEMGRFCIDPQLKDPDILRIAWGAMTRYVDETGVELLFGCSSFKGCEAAAYLDAFALLQARHIAPKRWLPRIKAPNVFRFAQKLRRKPDLKRAMRTMPPLLRSYLAMGGWVSDHAVVDRQLNTLHVFTGVEVREIPPRRRLLLRAIAG